MKTKVIIILSIIIVIIGVLIAMFLKINNDDKKLVELKYERVEKIIKDDNGNVIAEMYFNKPVLIGNQEPIKLINQLFENEVNGFFYGSNEAVNFKDGHYTQFMQSVDDGRKNYGDSSMVMQPFSNTVNIEVIYQDEKIISFKENSYWFAGGISNYYCYGITLDLQSGKILTIEEFTEQELEEFNDNILYQLSQNLQKEQVELKEDFIDEIRNYKFSDYNYYYDGNYTYLIFNNNIFNNSSYTLKLEN